MRNATSPCLDSFCRLDRLGLTVTAQNVEPDHSVLVCSPTTPATPCPECAGAGTRHDTVVRRLSHVPFGWKPTILQVNVPRYRCADCARVWRHELRAAAPSRGKLSRDAVTLAVKHIVIDRLSIAKPSRLLAMVEGRSKQALKTWLQQQSDAFRDGVEIVAMDGFAGYKTATVESIDDVVTVMDPFHVVALAGEKLDQCRQRLQQDTLGHRGRSGDPLYGIRRLARTRAKLLTIKQWFRLLHVFRDDCHAPFELTWEAYQRVIDAYQAPDPAEGKQIMETLIDAINTAVPTGLEELRTLGRTLQRRRDDVLAFFDHPNTSNGPTEAINGLIEHLRGTARGFRNLHHYIARSLLDAGGFRPLIHSYL